MVQNPGKPEICVSYLFSFSKLAEQFYHLKKKTISRGHFIEGGYRKTDLMASTLVKKTNFITLL